MKRERVREREKKKRSHLMIDFFLIFVQQRERFDILLKKHTDRHTDRHTDIYAFVSPQKGVYSCQCHGLILLLTSTFSQVPRK